MSTKKIAALMICALLCGCVAEKPEPSPTETPEAATKKIEVTGSPVDTNDYEPMGKYTLDITGDGTEDLVTLYTSAQRDNRGEMMWDDTQEWILSVETENGVYELYKERIHGFAYINIADYYKKSGDEKVISAHIFGNAFNEIREYSYTDNLFAEKIVYSTDKTAVDGINTIYSSIPSYE